MIRPVTFDLPDRKKRGVYHRIPTDYRMQHIPISQECWCRPKILSPWEKKQSEFAEIIINHTEGNAPS